MLDETIHERTHSISNLFLLTVRWLLIKCSWSPCSVQLRYHSSACILRWLCNAVAVIIIKRSLCLLNLLWAIHHQLSRATEYLWKTALGQKRVVVVGFFGCYNKMIPSVNRNCCIWEGYNEARTLLFPTVDTLAWVYLSEPGMTAKPAWHMASRRDFHTL